MLLASGYAVKGATNRSVLTWLHAAGRSMTAANSCEALHVSQPPLWQTSSITNSIHKLYIANLQGYACPVLAGDTPAPNSFKACLWLAGAAVAIAMPMSIEAVCAYLGIVLAGCSVVGVADSFAPSQIQDRLRLSQAQAVVTQDVILRGSKTLPMYERIAAAHAPRAIVVPAQPDQGLQVCCHASATLLSSSHNRRRNYRWCCTDCRYS